MKNATLSHNGFVRELFSLQDEKYREFNSALIPTVNKNTVIGVRVPDIRKLAKAMKGSPEREPFLNSLPHTYHEQNDLHAIFICQEKNFDACISLLDGFLPFLDNWATCDMLTPPVLKKNREKLLFHIKRWLSSNHTYTVRFALRMLMVHFFDEEPKNEILDLAVAAQCEEYYVNMMVAWFFATALTKHYHKTLPYMTENHLGLFCHNKTISKACDSFCVPRERKEYLKTLRRTAR